MPAENKRELVAAAQSKITLSDYEIAAPRLLTPALAIYSDILDSNIACMLRLLGGADRWRPHIKTSKLSFTIKRLRDHGINTFKCATTLELLVACEAGAKDVLFSYPTTDASAARIGEIAALFPDTTISALVEHPCQIAMWSGSRVGLYIDVDSGMNRTGIPASDVDKIIGLAKCVKVSRQPFRGVHYYEGHQVDPILPQRIAATHEGYNELMGVVAAIQASGIDVEEVVTSGTPALPCALSFEAFKNQQFIHRVSPGTVVYNDCKSLAQLPAEYGLRPAALVISSVVSRPADHIMTCDAGHKSIAADSGVPSCCVVGHPALQPLKPSEEHLPLCSYTSDLPLGSKLYLIPQHVCPTVNNFDHALIISGGRITAIEPVSARGRETSIYARVAARAR